MTDFAVNLALLKQAKKTGIGPHEIYGKYHRRTFKRKFRLFSEENILEGIP